MNRAIPPVLYPTFIGRGIESLDPDALIAEGFEAVALDVDSTITPYHAAEIEPAVQAKLRDLGDSGLKLIAISNAFWSRVPQLHDIYGRGVIGGGVITPVSLVKAGENSVQYSKPMPHMVTEAGHRLGVALSKMILVGDQLFTDIPAANSAGAQSMLIHQRGREDHWAVRVTQRPVEAIMRHIMGLPREFPDRMERVA